MKHQEDCNKTGSPCCEDIMCPCDRDELESLRSKLAVAEKALEFYASNKVFSSDPDCSTWEGWTYEKYDKRSSFKPGRKRRP